MSRKKSVFPRMVAVLLLAIIPIAFITSPASRAAFQKTDADASAAGKSLMNPPVLGADLTYAGRPSVLIEVFNDPGEGDLMGQAMAEAGVRSLRFSFHGFYSPLGPEQTERVKAENKLTNDYPWFPIDHYVDFIAAQNLTTVVAVNVEEGPDVARTAIEKFIERGLRSKLVAVELSNEPWLNPRPWLPEDFAVRASEIILKLSPLGVRFALPLTVGDEQKTPTKLSDTVWTTRMLTALDSRVKLSTRADVVGVAHLYGRGVNPGTIKKFNEVVKPFSPRMRYLVTEFNIRSSLQGNPHLSNPYAMEFARKVADLMRRPEIEALYVHSVPAHSIVYYSTRRFATVIGQRDPRITLSRENAGWHLTPAGRVYALYTKLAWNGQIVAFGGSDHQQYWTIRRQDGSLITTFLNDSAKEYEFKIKVSGLNPSIKTGPRSIACFDEQGKQVEALSLPY